MNSRDELYRLIEDVDRISLSDSTIVSELIRWLPEHQIKAFIEDTYQLLRDDIWPNGGPDEDEDWDEPTEIYDEDYFFNEGVKAAEAAKQKRIEQYRDDRERYLQLMQCSEV